MPNYNDIIRIVEALIGKHDPYNHHGPRVSELSKSMAQVLELNEHEIEMMKVSGALHDIGKLLIRDEILNAPRRLNELEFSEIQAHTSLGYKLLSELNYDHIITDVALHHHENVDGSGYPHNLKKISIYSKCVRIIDVYDALTNKRVYREKMSPSDVKIEMEKFSGKWFDPELLKLFLHKVV